MNEIGGGIAFIIFYPLIIKIAFIHKLLSCGITPENFYSYWLEVHEKPDTWLGESRLACAYANASIESSNTSFPYSCIGG